MYVRPSIVVNMDIGSFELITRIKEALSEEGADSSYIHDFVAEALSGDYTDVAVVARDYADVNYV